MGRDLIAAADDARVRELARAVAEAIAALPADRRVEALNAAREELHRVSPFRDQPVDFVRWLPAESVEGNEYNPNKVAPPEMRLLELSIDADGYTQPVVAHEAADGRRVVVDGFHRSRIGKESKKVRKRVRGHLPVVQIRAGQTDETARMASTIRHNRARGKHGVEPMTGIVAHLAKKGWEDMKIAKELGMDGDEVLRFKQVTGLAELFADRGFSEAWDVLTDAPREGPAQ